ncbi:MAG: winged helix-turn-helix domain-containing protein [Acidimicrobiales bacterium]
MGTATGGLPELDPVVHAQPRLRIAVTLTTLGPGDQMTFPRLQELVGMTPGNLSTHLRKLEDAGYIAVEKAFRRRTPVTWLSITRTGRRALEDYTSAVHQLLATTRAPAVPPPDHHSPRDGAP